MHILGLVITVIFFIVGLLGTFLPALPGPLIIWAGMFIYGLFVGFENLTLGFYLAQALAVGVLFLIDYISVAIGTKRYGGSKYSIFGAVVGLVVGLIILGPLGIIIGPFLGAVLVELISGRPLENAFITGSGTLLGFFGGTVIKIIMEIAMIAWFFFIIFN